MKKSSAVLLVLAAALVLPGHARALGQCGLSSTTPVWIDFGTPELIDVFGKPGVVATSSTGDFPAKLRATGAKTLYWDMYLNRRVGTPAAPAEPWTMAERANRLFDFAAAQSGCEKPLIALNELFGASVETPWRPNNAQYRANVLTFLRTLAERGARSFLLISSQPFTDGDAREWWLEAARYADLVPEVYFNGRTLHAQGAILANRRLRMAFRRAVSNLTKIGIPSSKIGIMLGFQTAPGSGGRERLHPSEAWFELVKWQGLAAREVAKETKLGTVWSWGWATYSEAGKDPDKPAAACVWLWTRSPRLCNGPAAAGPRFNASRAEGQILLPAGVQCRISGRSMTAGEIARLAALTGDREFAQTVLLGRIVSAAYARVSARDVLAAERAVVAARFGGSRGAYLAALRSARASVSVARGVLADELRRLRIEAGLHARQPSAAEVAVFYAAYPDLLVRAVDASGRPWWLGRRTRGLALSSIAPTRIFRLGVGQRVGIAAIGGRHVVRALGPVRVLGSVPLPQARAAISAALGVFARREADARWLAGREAQALRSAICRRDEFPSAEAADLASQLPCLSAIGARRSPSPEGAPREAAAKPPPRASSVCCVSAGELRRPRGRFAARSASEAGPACLKGPQQQECRSGHSCCSSSELPAGQAVDPRSDRGSAGGSVCAATTRPFPASFAL